MKNTKERTEPLTLYVIMSIQDLQTKNVIGENNEILGNTDLLPEYLYTHEYYFFDLCVENSHSYV